MSGPLGRTLLARVTDGWGVGVRGRGGPVPTLGWSWRKDGAVLTEVGELRGRVMRGGEQGLEGPGLVLLRAPHTPSPSERQSPARLAPGIGSMGDTSHGTVCGRGWFWDDSGVLHLLCTLFLLLLPRLHHRSSSIRPLRLGTPDLEEYPRPTQSLSLRTGVQRCTFECRLRR